MHKKGRWQAAVYITGNNNANVEYKYMLLSFGIRSHKALPFKKNKLPCPDLRVNLLFQGNFIQQKRNCAGKFIIKTTVREQ